MVPDLLDIRNLRIEATSYPPDGPPRDVVLVDDVSVSVAKGRVLGLIGESGAGKSTIGLSAMAYGRGGVRLTGGEIWLNGQDLRKLGAGDLRSLRGRQVTYVAQSAAAAFNPAKKAVRILDPRCVGKTFPDYFEALLGLVSTRADDVPVITIDGPTASGKGTLAAVVAQKLGYHFLDSGSLYRVTALVALREGLLASGAWGRTVVVVATEFGRPPEFDGRGGRGHQGTAFSMVLAGGGLKHCGAYGVTDELAKKPVEISVERV